MRLLPANSTIIQWRVTPRARFRSNARRKESSCHQQSCPWLADLLVQPAFRCLSEYKYEVCWPITVGARSEAWNIFAHKNTEIMDSNSTRGMDVCVYSVFVLSCIGIGLVTGWSPVQLVLPTLCKIHSFRIISERDHARGSNPSK
jgi:hypothetical protein